MKNLLLITLLLLFLGSTTTKPFPKIEEITVDGKTINNDYFLGKKTLVVHFFIGCHAAMTLVKDIQESSDFLKSYQVLLIAENTSNQIKEFNTNDTGAWASIRKHYNLLPISNDIIGECKTENLRKEGENVIIGQQCKIWSKKLKAKISPTIIFVNENGKIIGKQKGYLMASNPKELEEIIDRHF